METCKETGPKKKVTGDIEAKKVAIHGYPAEDKQEQEMNHITCEGCHTEMEICQVICSIEQRHG